MKTLIGFMLCWLPLMGYAQEGRPWERYLNEVMTVEDAESAAWEEMYELLCDLEQYPLDINRVTREQLEQLPFLSAQQVEGIMEYIDHYGPLKSVGELAMVRALDYGQRQLLSYFIDVGEEPERGFPKLSTITKYGKGELTATARVPFYERKGDKNGYLGYPYRHWLRCQFTYGDYVKFGLVGAQDAGEPFFAYRNKTGYDYYSPYLQLRQLGRIETLVVGNYRVSMGMGLVLNNGFSLGKVSMLQNLGRSTNGIRAHSSRAADYLRGAAATVNLGQHVTATALFSYRPMDATLNQDSTAATILTTGYHRTEAEMEKKNNLNVLTVGGSLHYRNGGLQVGMNAVHTQLSRALRPNTAVLYRQHYPQGSEFTNVSMDYRYVHPRIALNGETAVDKDGHVATINSVSLRLTDVLSVMALQRFYSYRYASLFAQSYSDGGRVQNESGVYAGLTWQPLPTLHLSAYTDYAYFGWAKYQVSQSSYAWDNLVQATYTRQGWMFGGRYRLRMRQKDGDGQALDTYWEHRGRLSAEYATEQGFGGRAQLDGDFVQGARGVMLSGSLSYAKRWLRLNAGAGCFHTDGYDSRIYLYERAPLYTYSVSQFHGEGIRYWLMVRANIGKRLLLTAKMGTTDYFDRSVIGSSYQQIDASSQTDLDLQLRWKF